MPSRTTYRKDPFPNITNWDDGYEYIRPDGPGASDSPYYSPASSNAGTPRDLPRPPPGRDADRNPRARYPSPISAAETFSRPRRRHTEVSPPRRSRRLSPSPDRRGRETRYPPQASQGRPVKPLGRTASHPLRPEGTRERPRAAHYSRSPSPVRMRRGREDVGYRDYRRPDSPPRAPPRGMSARGARGAYARSPSPPPPRYTSRRRRAETYRAPSPPPATRLDDDSRRSNLARSKTTSSKAKGRAGLSPKWQKAATAALQAGSAAAFNLRSEPGAWKGDKGIRVATAALGAGAYDAFNKSSNEEEGGRSSSRPAKRHSEVEALGGALSGLLIDQIAARAGGGKRH